jgi:hypothetical protein
MADLILHRRRAHAMICRQNDELRVKLRTSEANQCAAFPTAWLVGYEYLTPSAHWLRDEYILRSLPAAKERAELSRRDPSCYRNVTGPTPLYAKKETPNG